MKPGEPRYFTPWRSEDAPPVAPRFVVFQVVGLVFAFDGNVLFVGRSEELRNHARRKAMLKLHLERRARAQSVKGGE